MSVSTPEPHLRQKISLLWVRKPSPTKETEHLPQLKHSLCHWRSWKQINLAPLRPVKQLEKKSNLFFQQKDGAFYQVHFWELEIKQWVRLHQESNQEMMPPAMACIYSGMTPTGSSFEIQPDTQSILSHNLHKNVELGYTKHIFLETVRNCLRHKASLCGSESACNAGGLGSIPGLGRSPGEGKGYPLQYSGLENSIDCISPGGRKVVHGWAIFTRHKEIQGSAMRRRNKFWSQNFKVPHLI